MNIRTMAAAAAALLISTAAFSQVATPREVETEEVSAAKLADLIIEDAKHYIGAPYSYGASGPRSFDCSGFTGYVFKHFGITLSRTSRDQAKDGRSVEGSIADMQKGDLVLFSGRRNGENVGHVGIFIEATDGGRDFRFIHAAVHGGITISNYSEQYYTPRFRGARRLIPDFLPEAEEADSTWISAIEKGLSADIEKVQLGEGDRIVVIMEDGNWAEVGADGKLIAPGGNSKLVLDEKGRWTSVETVRVRIPSLETAVSSEPKGSVISPDAVKVDVRKDTTKTAETVVETPSEPEPVYHTIKSGDTLYGIALKYHTTVRKICSLNEGVTERTTLKIGRRVRVK